MPPKTSPKRVAHRRQRPPGWRPWDAPAQCWPGPVVSAKTRESFRAKVKLDEFDCWIFSGKQFSISDVTHTPRHASWRIYKSDAPPRFIEPTCGTERCVNPHHLIGSDELCTKGLHPMAPENVKLYADGRRACLQCWMARFERCKRGHDMDESSKVTSRGWRVCAECIRIVSAEYHEANREEVLAKRRRRYAERREEYLERKRREYREMRARMSPQELAEYREKAARRKRARRARMSDPSGRSGSTGGATTTTGMGETA